MATVTALVDPACLGAATCTPTTSPAVAVHVLLGGTRIASVSRGGGLDGLSGAKYRYTPYGQVDRAEGVTALTDSERDI